MLAFSFSQHFVLITFPRVSIYSLLLVSINTSPFLRDLNLLIPTFISMGLILDFHKPLLVSGDCIYLDLIVSFKSLLIFIVSKIFRVELPFPAARWYHSTRRQPRW
jgi:hypothetical protein